MNSIVNDGTPVKCELQQEHLADLSTLNQHELTNHYRRLAEEFGFPACVEQQRIAEWLSEYDSAEAFS